MDIKPLAGEALQQLATEVAQAPARGLTRAKELIGRTAAVARHHRRMAAVDVDRRAGDVGACIGGQEAGEVGELLGLADAPQRNVLHAAGDVVLQRDALLRGALHVLIGFDEARPAWR